MSSSSVTAMNRQIGYYIRSMIRLKNLPSERLNFQQCRYAYFPPEFQPPIVSPKTLQEMEESSEIDDLKFQPFLPAPISASSSVFYDPKIERFINFIMTGGNKSTARELLERTFYEIKKTQLLKRHKAESEEERNNIECNPVTIFHTAVKNCSPLLTVMPIKRGAIVYQVPTPLTAEKSEYFGARWILQAARDKDLRTQLPPRLAKELIDAFNFEGRVIKKKQDLHKLCEANRAYAHFRWS